MIETSYLIIIIVLLTCLCNVFGNTDNTYDFAHVHYAKNMEIYQPESIEELQLFLQNNRKKFCIKGAGYSHGGQTLCNNATQINLKNINFMYLLPNNNLVVGAGAIWYDVLQYLVQHNRCVAEMQSYYNFSVGGSISVNCHGRGMQYGSISDSIVGLYVLSSNGKM